MQDDNQSGWVFSPGQDSMQQPPTEGSGQPSAPGGDITWTASEFIEHHKTAGWYIGSTLIAVLGIGAVYLITKDVISIVVLGLFAAVFIGFAARKPRTLQYVLRDHTITVGEQQYNLTQFKSFSVIEEGPIRSISLLPLKRFMPTLTIYYALEDEEAITNFLSAQLPYEERKQDSVDRLMRKIRF